VSNWQSNNSNKMVKVVDNRPSRPGAGRRRKRRGASSESSSYWQGNDGTVVRNDGTFETPVRPGTELDFGASEVAEGSTATASTASMESSGTHPGTSSNPRIALTSPTITTTSKEVPTITTTSKEVTPSEEERKPSSDAGASKHVLDQESSTTAPAVSSPVATVASPINKLQHQVDFLEEQLQLRTTEIEGLQADLKSTKSQLADTATATAATATVTATATAIIDRQQENIRQMQSQEQAMSDMQQEHTRQTHSHEQAIIDMQQENIRQMQSLTDQYERALQERDTRHKRVLQQRQELQERQQLLEQQLVTQHEQLARQEATEQEFLIEWRQLQEVQDKGDRDAQQANVRHAKELQRCKEKLKGSDKKLKLAEQEIRLLKEKHQKDLEFQKLVDEKCTKELRQQEQARYLERAQMETTKAEEIAALRASLLDGVRDDSTLQKALKASKERHKLDLARADETFHKLLQKRDARHQEQMEDMQFALKAQTDEIADLTTSLREQDLGIVAQKALADESLREQDLGIVSQKALSDRAVHNQETETKELEKSRDREKRMKEEFAAELKKRDECHREELEKLQGVLRSKTSKIAAMKESLHSLEGTLKADSETTEIDTDRRPFFHRAPTQKPFGHSSQVLEVEEAEPAIASKALPESPKVLKEQARTVEERRCRSDSEDNETATAPKRRRRSSPKDPPNGRDRSAYSKQLQRSVGTPVASFDYRSVLAANSAGRSLSVGRDRSADSKKRKRPAVKLIPGASLTHPSSAAASRAGHSTPPRGRESEAKSRAAKKARIVIDSPESDSDTVFSNNEV
jgi:hypothetical protein